MCGRYTLATPVEELARIFGFAERPNLAPRYNVAPTQDVAVVRGGADGDRHLAVLRWGLVPAWAKEASIGSRLINARAETLADKASFREALKRRRCLVPADGFYEWQAAAGGGRSPFHIVPRDGGVLALAGLWEEWRGPPGAPIDPPLQTVTIVTVAANALLTPLHDRMPAILDGEARDRWLDPATPVAAAHALLQPAADRRLTLVAVSTRVNAVRHDDAACIAPLPQQGSLL